MGDPPSPRAALRHPLVGMFGVFDRRVDGEALKNAARLSPYAIFVILGPIVDRDPAEFRDVSNIRFMGTMPCSDLPGHVGHFDLCILPHVSTMFPKPRMQVHAQFVKQGLDALSRHVDLVVVSTIPWFPARDA